MKNFYNSALHWNRKSFAVQRSFHNAICSLKFYLCLLILTGFLFTACKKEGSNTSAEELQNVNIHAVNSEGNVIDNYTSLSSQTMWELQQARAATARYGD